MALWNRFPREEFPNLTYGKFKNHRSTSIPATRYNCIAWAADDTEKWWWPQSIQGYWPVEVTNEESLPAFIEAFELLGYEQCSDGSLEAGIEKIAIYTLPDDTPTHAARQLSTGKWTSKLGPLKDIRHDTLEAVNSRWYGAARCYLKRPRKPLTVSRIRFLFFRSLRVVYKEIRSVLAFPDSTGLTNDFHCPQNSASCPRSVPERSENTRK